jgi:hypothetical protein
MRRALSGLRWRGWSTIVAVADQSLGPMASLWVAAGVGGARGIWGAWQANAEQLFSQLILNRLANCDLFQWLTGSIDHFGQVSTK